MTVVAAEEPGKRRAGTGTAGEECHEHVHGAGITPAGTGAAGGGTDPPVSEEMSSGDIGDTTDAPLGKAAGATGAETGAGAEAGVGPAAVQTTGEGEAGPVSHP